MKYNAQLLKEINVANKDLLNKKIIKNNYFAIFNAAIKEGNTMSDVYLFKKSKIENYN